MTTLHLSEQEQQDLFNDSTFVSILEELEEAFGDVEIGETRAASVVELEEIRLD